MSCCGGHHHRSGYGHHGHHGQFKGISGVQLFTALLVIGLVLVAVYALTI